MLIILHADEYLPSLTTVGDGPDFTAFVEALVAVLTAGEHAIACKPRLMLKLAELDGLSANQRGVLREVGRELTQPDGHADWVTDALVISGPVEGSPAAPPAGQRWFRRPWSSVRSVGDLRQAVMAAENGADARWYRWLARAYSTRVRPTVRPPGGDVNLACHGLGGSTTSEELGAFVHNAHPTLCIADSDRAHPGATLGETAKQIHKAIGRLETPTPVACVCLEARDLENMLPLPLLKLAAGTSEWLKPMSARGFFIAHDRPLDPALAYIDLGKDQCRLRLLEEKSDPAIVSYHARAIDRMTACADASGAAACPGAQCSAAPSGAPCAAKDDDGAFKTTPPACRYVFSLGKGKRGAVYKAVGVLDNPRRGDFDGRPPAEWLADQLPQSTGEQLKATPPIGPVWSLARRAWSWGLCRRPRNPSSR